MPGPSPKIRGPGPAEQIRGSSGSESGLTPQPAYEPTGSFPSQPTWGGRARFTRNLASNGTYESGGVQEQQTEPKYERGPTRTFKKTT